MIFQQIPKTKVVSYQSDYKEIACTSLSKGGSSFFSGGGKIRIYLYFPSKPVKMAREARRNFFLPPPGNFLPPPDLSFQGGAKFFQGGAIVIPRVGSRKFYGSEDFPPVFNKVMKCDAGKTQNIFFPLPPPSQVKV